MTHQQPLTECIRLPLPSSLSSRTGQWCELKARPRWGEDGVFLGFHGVVDPVAEPVTGPADDAVVAPLADACGSQPGNPDAGPESQDCGNGGVVPTPMTEADQEVLRYALSHDLRAPLRVVDGFTRIVKEDYSKVLDRMGVDHLDRVLAAAARMNGMIDAILAQAQLAGAPLARDRIDLTALARDIATELGSMPGACAAAHFEIAEGMTVEADTVLVRRVLENLISNALKYSAKVAQPLIEIGVMPATNPAVFYVRDNGAGFDMQRADKLFGLFQRMHSAKDFPGTGVGLAGVHNIIRRHGGQVWAEASPGKGACFYFTLMGTAEAQQRASSRIGQA
ncbi:MAG: sensor histidine kinase [Acidobacteriota bacterium]